MAAEVEQAAERLTSAYEDLIRQLRARGRDELSKYDENIARLRAKLDFVNKQIIEHKALQENCGDDDVYERKHQAYMVKHLGYIRDQVEGVLTYMCDMVQRSSKVCMDAVRHLEQFRGNVDFKKFVDMVRKVERRITEATVDVNDILSEAPPKEVEDATTEPEVSPEDEQYFDGFPTGPSDEETPKKRFRSSSSD